MLDVRVHRVLDRTVVSVHCRAHGGPSHCLYTGSSSKDLVDTSDLLRLVSDAVAHVADLAHRDALEELTSDCIW